MSKKADKTKNQKRSQKSKSKPNAKSKKTPKPISSDPVVIAVITKIAKAHCYKTFGYLDVDDLKQEIWRICLSKLDTFDEDFGHEVLTLEQKLEHYLRSIVSNRLINTFKKITKSVRKPCFKCPHLDAENKLPCGGERGVKSCENKMRAYVLSVDSRNSLLYSVDPAVDGQWTEEDILGNMVTDEVLDTIEELLDDTWLHDFQILRQGGSIPKYSLRKLKEQILYIIKESGIEF